ncbi:MAG TPA: phosphoribosylglycinamide formyltransferase [Usitatibacter sp.]|nr:phosphoribosylglycinamide formyltransferase [Usitatibacter sp.]
MNTAAILISGGGSNMRALVQARTGLEVVAVVSSRSDAPGLAWADGQGLPTRVVEHQRFRSREAFDDALVEVLDAFRPDYLLLAGFMRVLTPGFIARYPRRMLNIHPSLLPAFPGLHTHRQALASGVKLHGCTVHFVTAALDSGPIVIQAAVPVLASDTEQKLAARVLAAEHRIYPQAARWLAEGRLEFAQDQAVQVRGAAAPSASFVCPLEEP